VWLLKNPSGRLCRSLSLRRFVAAEKRDYAEHSTFRQQFLQNFFLPVSAANPRNPNPLLTPQTLVVAAFAARFVLRGGEY
ncbi:hypothetical protein, partial [Cupriavidus sp. D384]|uniref:hypothetical protein n=1 Tax=Cupriavidus sp. D384 TaxID=1538095 RepID=UPI0018D2C725